MDDFLSNRRISDAAESLPVSERQSVSILSSVTERSMAPPPPPPAPPPPLDGASLKGPPLDFKEGGGPYRSSYGLERSFADAGCAPGKTGGDLALELAVDKGGGDDEVVEKSISLIGRSIMSRSSTSLKVLPLLSLRPSDKSLM